MSKINEKSPKHCAQKQALNFNNFNKKLFYYFSTFFLTILSLLLLVWLIFHPTKPRFYLKQADIKHFKLTGPFLNSSIQLTILSNNVNKNVGIYYDELALYASYNDQNISHETYISPFYQEHGETNLISTSLVGNQQPVSPFLAYEVQRDKGSGKVALSFELKGKLRWKMGTWVSKRHMFSVNCITITPFMPTFSTPWNEQGTECSTTV